MSNTTWPGCTVAQNRCCLSDSKVPYQYPWLPDPTIQEHPLGGPWITGTEIRPGISRRGKRRAFPSSESPEIFGKLITYFVLEGCQHAVEFKAFMIPSTASSTRYRFILSLPLSPICLESRRSSTSLSMHSARPTEFPDGNM